MAEQITLVCPYCRRKFNVSSPDLMKRYSHSGIVPIFCTLQCEIRFSEQGGPAPKKVV